ncbi:MAG: PAS domain-containing protein [Nitrospira sp.]|nr:PAS domain-containing protein [Nitrospira sp.]
MVELSGVEDTQPAVITTAPDGVITSLNPAAERLLDIAADAVIGQLTPTLFHDPAELAGRMDAGVLQAEALIADRFDAIVARARIGQVSQEEWIYVHRDGHRRPVLLTVCPVPDTSGNVIGYCLVVRDKDKQVGAEELLRHQAELLHLANDAILVRDLDRDTITYWNDGAVRLYGWTAEAALGAYIHHFLRTRFPRRRTITVSSRWTLLRDSQGRPTGSLELNTDITEQKRAQEALKVAHEELERRVDERTAALSEANERLRVLSRRLMEIQESERRAIARDLHDEIGQALTAMKLNLRELRTLPNCEHVEEQIADSLEILAQVLQRVRSLALDLRPSLLDELGLVPALRWYAGRQAERAGWELRFSAEGAVTRPSPEIEIACFRLAQEALTNVARHSRAEWVEVRLEFGTREVVLVIRDGGIGFDLQDIRNRAHAGTSIGLSGMEERVRLAGGEFAIHSTPGEGTEIRALFPTKPEPRLGENAPT